jgi:hypothetical protein
MQQETEPAGIRRQGEKEASWSSPNDSPGDRQTVIAIVVDCPLRCQEVRQKIKFDHIRRKSCDNSHKRG